MLIIMKKVNKAPWTFKGDDAFQGNKNVVWTEWCLFQVFKELQDFE